MKILARYLFMNLFQPLIYLLIAFALLFIIGDLMDTMKDFNKILSASSGTGFWDVGRIMLHYYSLQLPSMVIFIVPICLLLATLYSLSQMTRHSEIVAMRASGVSIYRIVRPYLLLGFFCFLFTAVVNEYTGPKYAYRAHQLLESKTKASDDVYFENIAYKNPTLGHEWHIVGFDTRSYTMQGITLRIRREDGSDREKITAKKGHWLDRRWWFEDGEIQRFDENNTRLGPPETFQTLEMRYLKERPEEFMREAKDSAHQSSLELYEYIRTHQHLSLREIRSDLVDLHHKLTMPFICIIAVLIGIPVGTHTGRKGALSGIMMAIGLFFTFYATQFTMEYLAKQLYIQPWIGAWSAIIAFFFIGTALIYRMR
ncbi:YjgP/YjgQ family permease [Verrucomicrobia bacterium S94]|nr:YjgP/YjgQ family permease [Verrucomicrobia bacterium S94]